jgi:nicotinate-nucleotide--dimethylbenzimidazole phosphoribosyltransferase
MISTLEDTIKSIRPLDVKAMEAARLRQASLTKPRGALGRLEELSIRLAGITGQARPRFNHKAVILMAADHGVVEEGVSLYPQAVTREMVLNFLRGGAGINALARLAGARVAVVDMGVAGDFPPTPGLSCRMVDYGTKNMAQGPAMTRSQARGAVEAGIAAFEDEYQRGLDLAATGDMGIGNTTASAAIAAAFTGQPPEGVTGQGTGVEGGQYRHKTEVIRRALALNRPDPADALDVLSKVGGFEIGGLAGVILGAAARRVPVVIDGYISGAAALVAAGLVPVCGDYLVAGHVSAEPGHRIVLKKLGLEPLLDLGMRLGEGTGAALAMLLVEAAARTLDEMATFSEAGVSDIGTGG